ncbi:MAG: hypothetical protein GY864_08015 [Desulfobacterales bacterium]|nr:hypothetical protein [Desulfobacterales bacterium]
MKKAKTAESTTVEDMRPEYDLSAMKGGVRGKYYKAYREGHQVIVHKEDGTDAVQYFKLEDGAVMLEPDVRRYFPTSDAVNKALRSLIEIISAKKRAPSGRK